MKLSIIIPLYNEERTLEKIIHKVQSVNLGNIKKELILINDASKDNSNTIIKSLLKKYSNIRSIEHRENQGKGAAIRTGIRNSSGDIIVIQDGDLEYNPEDFKRMIIPILEGKTKVVYGSRFMQKNKFQLRMHYYANRVLSLITRIFYNVNLTDMETCYKMMTSDVAKSLNLVSNRFEIEPEITSKILKKGYKILEIPISYEGRSFQEGKKIGWKDGMSAVFSLIRWKFS